MLITNPKKDLLRIQSSDKMHSIEIKEKEDKTFEILNDGQPIGSGSGGSLPEVQGSGKSLVSVNGEWKEQDGYGYVENVERQYIVPEQNITLKTNYQKIFYIDWSIGLEEDVIYEVVFDGSSYELEGWKFDDPGWNNKTILGEAEIGDIPSGESAFSPKFGNYPFCLLDDGWDASANIYFTDCEPHNVKIINKSTSEILLDVNNISGIIRYVSNSSVPLPNVFESGREYQININDDSYSIVWDNDNVEFYLELAESGNKCIDIWNSSYGYDDVKYLSVEYRIDKEITLPATLTIKDGDEILYNKKIFSNLVFWDIISANTTIPYSVALGNFDETSTSPQIVEVNIDGDVYKTQINHGGDVFYGGADFIPISGSSEIGYEVDFSNYPFFFYVDLFTAEQPQIVFFMSNENGNEHTISIYTETEEVVGIDKKYLPEGVGYDKEDVIFVDEQEIETSVISGAPPYPLCVVEWAEGISEWDWLPYIYQIEFDGEIYEEVLKFNAGGLFFGDLDIDSEVFDFNRIPFGVVIVENKATIVTEFEETHTISIKRKNTHVVPYKYLPERVYAIVDWDDSGSKSIQGINVHLFNNLTPVDIFKYNINSILLKVDPDNMLNCILNKYDLKNNKLYFYSKDASYLKLDPIDNTLTYYIDK